MALEKPIADQLEEIQARYKRLSNVVSTETEAEAEKLKDVVEKYETYVALKKMMIKFRSLYKNEVSPPRKEKQLNIFVNLYRGKLELEQMLRAKVGTTSKFTVPKTQELAEFEAISKQITELEKRLAAVEVKIPSVQYS